MALDAIREALPPFARDLGANLALVLGDTSLSRAQALCVSVACARAVRDLGLLAAFLEEARLLGVPAGDLDDAHAAASLMASSNVYYRFRKLAASPAYAGMPSRLRLKRSAELQGEKAGFELCCVAASAIGNCEDCVRAHEAKALAAGATEAQLHDAVRIAAVVQGLAVARG